MGKILTQEQVDSFHRDGFLSPIDIFSEEEALNYRTELEAAEKKWPEAFEGASPQNAHLCLKCLDEILHNKTLLDAAEDIVGLDI